MEKFTLLQALTWYWIWNKRQIIQGSVRLPVLSKMESTPVSEYRPRGHLLFHIQST